MNSQNMPFSLLLSSLFALLTLFPVQKEAAAPDSADLKEKVASYLSAHYANGTFSGTVLISHPEFEIQSYAGKADYSTPSPHTSETFFQAAALSMPVTAAYILHLSDRGLLSVDDSIGSWFPQKEHWHDITVYDLLAHKSGLPDYTQHENFESVSARGAKPEQLVQMIDELAADFPPGSDFGFTNSGYLLLSFIAESVTGKTFTGGINAFIKENGITGLRFEDAGDARFRSPKMATGYTRISGTSTVESVPVHPSVRLGAAGLLATAEGLGTFFRKLHNGELISEASLSEMRSPGSANYGLGLTLGPVLDKPASGHAGGISGFASNIIRFSGDDIIIVILSNLETAAVGPMMRDLASMIYGKPWSAPVVRQAAELDEDALKRVSGTYELEGGIILNFEESGGMILMRAGRSEPVVFSPESEYRFFSSDNEMIIEFDLPDSEAEATGLTLYQGTHLMQGQRLRDKD